MALPGELQVGFPDLFLRGAARNAESCVIVLLLGSHGISLSHEGTHSTTNQRYSCRVPPRPFRLLLFLVVYVNELGVDNVVFGFAVARLGTIACGTSARGTRIRRRATLRARFLIHRLGQFVAGLGQFVLGGVDLFDRAARNRLLGLFERRFDVFGVPLRRSCRDAPSTSYRRCRPSHRPDCALRSCRAACDLRRRAIRRPWPSCPLRPCSGRRWK